MTEFENLSPNDIRKTAKAAIAYSETFAGDPWKEARKCPNKENLFYGREYSVGDKCPCGCGGKLLEAYPILKTTRYIRKEISKPNAIAKVVEKDDKVVAFGWGYEETGREFAESKYDNETNWDAVSNIAGGDKKRFYISEIGVIEPEQASSEKYGSKITQEIANEATKRGNPLLLRTLKSKPDIPSRMDGIAKSKLKMKPIMGSDDTPPDPENSDRILYYKE